MRSSRNPRRADAILIGAGPAGLAAGIYLARAGWKAVVIDGDSPGGQARRIGRIENYPGFPSGISGRELMERFVRQGARWGLRFVRARALRVSRREGLFRVETSSGRLKGRSLLLCSGSEFRALGIPREDSLDGVFRGAFGLARRYRRRAVAVVGGGEAAVHQALLLARHARRVTLICRGSRVKAIPLLQKALGRCPRIRPLYRCVVTAVQGARRLQRIEVRDFETGRTRRLRAEALFVLVGKTPNLTPVPWRRAPPGFFLAGDVRQGAFRQVAIAAGDGVRAAMTSDRYLRGHR